MTDTTKKTEAPALDETSFDELLTKLGLSPDDAKNIQSDKGVELTGEQAGKFLAGLLEAIRAEIANGRPSDPERKTVKLTQERSDRVDSTEKVLLTALADSLLAHGPDRAAPKIAATAIVQFILSAEKACFPGLSAQVVGGIQFAREIGYTN